MRRWAIAAGVFRGDMGNGYRSLRLSDIVKISEERKMAYDKISSHDSDDCCLVEQNIGEGNESNGWSSSQIEIWSEGMSNTMTSPAKLKMGYLCNIIGAILVVDISREIGIVFPIEFNCFRDVDSTIKGSTNWVSTGGHVLSRKLGS